MSDTEPPDRRSGLVLVEEEPEEVFVEQISSDGIRANARPYSVPQ